MSKEYNNNNIQALIQEYKNGIDVYEQLEKELRNLTFKLIHKYKFATNNDIQETEQLCRIALFKAMNQYNKDKRNILFSTFYYTVAKNEILMYKRKEGKHDKIKKDAEGNEKEFILSLDKKVEVGTNEHNLQEIIASEVNIEEELIENEKTKWLYDTIEEFGKLGIKDNRYMNQELKKDIMYYLVKDSNQTACAEYFRVHRQTVLKTNKAFIKFASEKAIREGLVVNQ